MSRPSLAEKIKTHSVTPTSLAMVYAFVSLRLMSIPPSASTCTANSPFGMMAPTQPIPPLPPEPPDSPVTITSPLYHSVSRILYCPLVRLISLDLHGTKSRDPGCSSRIKPQFPTWFSLCPRARDSMSHFQA
ncbi:hypothetical protein AALP_AA6G166500 [Arabis alpina]|uniref:Uncharacterized protein n=1 Tax=Arabis alpina TaxID=50452 RepID=A0A087GPP7_ARAAL|nr:hypothetical protein AALP_AA6G166500 [Arabis alpina]